MMISRPLNGIIPPLVTPLKPQQDLDLRSLEALIEHVISGGIHGIFLLGSTGEGPSLSHDVKKVLIHEGIMAISGRVPVLVNISSASFRETMQMSDLAAREGADYVVLSPPYYFEMNNAELLNYYIAVADHSPLHLVLYNAPKYTKSQVEPGLVGELFTHPNIYAIKDSSGSMDYIRELLKVRGQDLFPILIGPEMLLGESLLLGCNGGVNGGANLYPSLYVEYYQSAMEKDLATMERIQELLRKIQTRLYGVARSPMGIVIGLKYLLEKRGLCSGQMAMSVYEPLSSEQKHILNTLDQEILQL